MSDVVLNRASLRTLNLPDYSGVAIDAVILVVSAMDAEEALPALMSADAIGFDTESKPTFRKGEVPTGPHLIQLATDDKVYLFPVSASCPSTVISALQTILESPRVLKVGFGLSHDRNALKTKLGIEVRGLLDLCEKLRGPGHRGQVGAQVAVAHFFGQKLQKSRRIGTSNWASARLTESQCLYAANDAHAALRVYRAWLQSREGDSTTSSVTPVSAKEPSPK